MPFYLLRNNDTSEVREEFLGISECDQYLIDNPHIERLPNGVPMLVGGHGDRVKPDNGMKEMLSRVAEASPHSPLASRYGHKDTKSVKVRETVQKHNKLK